MNKVLKFFSSFIFLLSIWQSAAAQYKDLLEPLYDWEVAALKKNHIAGEQLYLLDDNGRKVHFQNRAYDGNGHMLACIDHNQRKYYLYDAEGRLISFMDSSRKEDDSWSANEYHITYDEAGHLSKLTSNGFVSEFTFDPERNTLREKQLHNDTTTYSVYFYDRGGRLIEMAGYDATGQRNRHETYIYGDKGRINKQSVTIFSGAGHDSTLTVYQYNDHNVLTHKMVFNFLEMLIGGKDNGDAATTRATHYEVSDYDYKYDQQGRLIADVMSSKQNPLSAHTFLYTYDDRGLRIKESYARGKVDPHVIIREYIASNRY